MRSVLLLCAFCVGKHFTISLLAGVLPPEDHVGGCSKQCPEKTCVSAGERGDHPEDTLPPAWLGAEGFYHPKATPSKTVH